PRRLRARVRAAQARQPQRAVTEVAVDVAPGPAAPEGAVADDLTARGRPAPEWAVGDEVPAGDRAEARAVRVLEHREDGARRAAALVAVAALEGVPAEVVAAAPLPPSRAAGDEVDLLDLVLADVADDEGAGSAVEREAPRIPQPIRVDLREGAGAPAEGIVGRDRVAAVRLWVDPDQLGEHPAQVLAVLV